MYWKDKTMNMNTIFKMVSIEWEQFQNVHEENCHISCQNDFRTFFIIRASQFLSWDDATILSYFRDLQTAMAEKHNLFEEKYALMMSFTEPDRYALIRDRLPAVSSKKESLTRKIVEIQLAWQREFSEKYPDFSSGARMTAESDTRGDGTPFENYLCSELLTYSENTLHHYLAHVKQFLSAGINMNILNQEFSAKLSGVLSLQGTKVSA